MKLRHNNLISTDFEIDTEGKSKRKRLFRAFTFYGQNLEFEFFISIFIVCTY